MNKKLRKVISNSSPLIGLAIINQVPLLWELFEEVIIPEAVYREVVEYGKNKYGKKEIQSAIQMGKINVYCIKDEKFVTSFLGKLHRGELEVILAARELNARYLLLDDKAARAFAETLLLEPIGLIGLLRIAKISGKIKLLKPHLDKLIDSNYRIAKNLYREILLDTGEIQN
jgi:predicted nucleic acid-binding protein